MKTRILSVAALIGLAIWAPSYEYKVRIIFENTKKYSFDPGDLNNKGEVAGTLIDEDRKRYYAMKWISGNFYPLESLGFNTRANGINDLGLTCGSTVIDSRGRFRAVKWLKDGSIEDLGLNTTGTARDITNDGLILGTWMVRFLDHPYFWSGGKALGIPLSFPQYDATLLSTSETGAATGVQFGEEGMLISQWLWRPGEAKVTETPFWVVDLNSFNAGCGRLDGYAAIFTPDGIVQKVLDPKTNGTSLNDSGVLVGSVFVNNDGDYGMIWEDIGKPGKRLSSLIDPKLNLEIGVPQAINNAGQILATAFSVDRKRDFVVLLEPTKATKRNSVVPTDRFWKVDP